MNGIKILTFSGSDPALKRYEGLLYTSFLSSLRYGNEWFKEIDADVYYEVYHKLIENLLGRRETLVKLAVLPDDPDTCIGWSISEPRVLHYIYVKGDIKARQLGIGKQLLPLEFNTISHLTKIGKVIWKKKFKHVKFNPFLA